MEGYYDKVGSSRDDPGASAKCKSDEGRMSTNRDKILKLLNEKDDLPPLPDVLINLNKKINDPKTDIEEISKLIETEPVLSGRLIKLANSVLFGGGRDKAEDLQTAIMRLGLKMVLDLAYTLELPGMFKRRKSFNELQLWKHSLAVAFLSQTLADRASLTPEDKDAVYTAGLMHDIGILVFDFLQGNEYGRFLKDAAASETSLEKLEQEHFGISHSELGAEFIEKRWPIAKPVVEAVGAHHQALTGKARVGALAKIVDLANRLANHCGIVNGLTEHQSPAPARGFHTLLGLEEEEFDTLLQKTREGVEQTELVLTG